jgi:Asp-tRNA(Asn)/Glu-tRNA(Gln) amidotransferase A subunit family amidase
VQLIGRPWAEATLLSIAAAYQGDMQSRMVRAR